jgi:tryptophanyl-tRNA synthetase
VAWHFGTVMARMTSGGSDGHVACMTLLVGRTKMSSNYPQESLEWLLKEERTVAERLSKARKDYDAAQQHITADIATLAACRKVIRKRLFEHKSRLDALTEDNNDE